METLKATFQIVTPMFLGGAKHEAESIRPPSFKGVLRFWWRALNWGRFKKQLADDVLALKALHNEEKALFGSAAEEEGGVQKGGQGCFLISIKNPQLNKATLTLQVESGIAYLLGQGLYKLGQNAQYLRDALEKNQEITVSIIFKKNLPLNIPADYQEQIEKALWIMGLLGGLGSRSRRGWGSLSLTRVTGSKLKLSIPNDVNSYREVLGTIIGDVTNISEPLFTAFSKDNRIDMSITGNDPMSILNTVGKEMIFYRSNGRSDGNGNRQILNENNIQKSDCKFWDDHDLIAAIANGTIKDKHPARVVFGLPHNYQFSSDTAKKNKVEMQPIHLNNKGVWTSDERGRRASPLFIHVHKFNNNSYSVIQTFLPSMFLPKDENIEMKQLIKKDNKYQLGIKPNVLYAVDWSNIYWSTIITGYMDKFVDKTGFWRII